MNKTSNLTSAAHPIRLRMPFGRRGWFIAGFALIAAGMVLNWGWLTAIGAAPLILALAPCAAMCAAGLCVIGGSKTCATKSDPAAEPDGSRDRAATIGRSKP